MYQCQEHKNAHQAVKTHPSFFLCGREIKAEHIKHDMLPSPLHPYLPPIPSPRARPLRTAQSPATYCAYCTYCTTLLYLPQHVLYLLRLLRYRCRLLNSAYPTNLYMQAPIIITTRRKYRNPLNGYAHPPPPEANLSLHKTLHFETKCTASVCVARPLLRPLSPIFLLSPKPIFFSRLNLPQVHTWY